jgi:nucleotide-binding universal stress UspA family protein
MFKKILVPLDGSPEAEAVVTALAGLPTGDATVVRLLHVAPVPSAVMDETRVVAYADQEADRLRHNGEVYLRRMAKQLAGFPVEMMVRFGDPAEEIVGEAQECGADLIAMASHRRAGVNRFLFGSVTESVLRETGVPVFVAQPAIMAVA